MGSRPNSQRTRNRGMRSPYKTVTGSGRSSSSNKAIVKQNLEKKAAETYKNYAIGNTNKLVRETRIERNFNNTVKDLRSDFKLLGQGAKNLLRSNQNKSRGYSYSSASGYAEAGQFARQIHDEQIRPKNMIEAAQAAAARDTATDRRDYYEHEHQSELSRDWLGRQIDSDYHNEMISWGQNIMYDQEAINDWILAGGNDQEINRRIKQVNDYFDNSSQYVEVYDPSVPEGAYGPFVQRQMKPDAELPPWVQANRESLNRWDYYKTYAHDVVEAAHQAHVDASEIARQRKLHPYTSAFATAEETGHIDSFLDVFINSFSEASKHKPSQVLPQFAKSLIEGTKQYGMEYTVNPLIVGYKTGTLKDTAKTVAGNALWNFMETADVFRGTRAFIAGQRRLGGERDVLRSFTDSDNEFWVTIEGHDDQEVRIAQDLFMKNGGHELIAGLRGQQLYGAAKSEEELKAQLEKAFRADAKLIKGITWEQVYDAIVDQYINGGPDAARADLRRGLENVKETYTNPDAKFEADTGNLATDMVLETVLDPSIIVGGLARSVVKSGVESAATTSMRRGLAEVFNDAEKAEAFLHNKKIQQYVRGFINSNEGRNILFKDINNLDDDVTSFIMKVNRENPAIFADPKVQDKFRRTVLENLSNKLLDTNANIIASTASFRDRFNHALLKSAYYTDKAFDSVDSAIVKSSFIVPWAGVKGAKAGFNNVITSKTVGKVINRLNLKRKNALSVLVSEKTGAVDVTNVPRLMEEYNKGLHNEVAVREALQQAVDQYDEVAWNLNDVIRKFSRGEINDEEALRLVGQHISDITGGKFKNLDELKGFIENHSHRYRGDLAEAYKRVDDTFGRLKDLIDHRSEDAIDKFLNGVREAHSEEELSRLIREYMDNDYVMQLRHEVITNSPIEGLTVEKFDNLVTNVRNGLYSEDSITRDAVQQATDTVAGSFKDTIVRTIDYSQFEDMLDRLDVDWRGALDAINAGESTKGYSSFEKKLAKFMSGWMEQKGVTYVIDDALKFIDRMERQVHFKQLMNIGTASEVSALMAHRDIAQFNKLRRMIKKLDLISLKDIKYILIPQMDRMALNLNFRNDKNIQNLYGSFYDDVIGPIWEELKKKSFDKSHAMESSFFDDIDQLARQKYGFDRTSQLIEQAKTLPGFSDEHLHSFLNTLATDFRFHDDLGNIDLSPGSIRRKIEATLRAQTGDSKVGMKNITDSLMTVNSDSPSDFLRPYMELFENEPALKEVYLKHVNKDVLDPSAYVDKQMIYTVLRDPSVIDDWNKLAAKGQTPIMFHINTTGLNNEINSVTSVSFRQWVPMGIPRTPEGAVDNESLMRNLLNNLEENEATVIQRHMTDDEFDEITEQVIRSLDIKDCDPSSIRNRYKEFYKVTDDTPYKSEQEMLEEACDYIRQYTRQVNDEGVMRSVAPSLVVHDLDGFNVNYFNNKIIAMRDVVDEKSAIYDYAERIAISAKYNSRNTYERLAEMSGDIYYTDDQIERITKLVQDYVSDINHFASGYRFNDMQSYSRKLHDIIDTLSLKDEAGQLTDDEALFLNAFNEAGGTNMLHAYDKSIKDITSLGYYPRQYAFLSTGLEDNLTKTALKVAGRDTINVNTRIYVDDVLSYFDLETEDGIYATIEDLRKMHNVAKYIKNTRDRQIVAGAEEFLTPHKEEFDRIIQSIKDIANSDAYDATSLAYLQNMKIPDNAIDSYLLARKLYNDHLKYWLDSDSLTSLHTTGKDLDSAKIALERFKVSNKLKYNDPIYKLHSNEVAAQAVDFLSSNRVRMFDELTAGGFDVDKLDRFEELSERFAEEQQDFWSDTSDSISNLWDDFREFNKSVREEYKEASDRLGSAYAERYRDLDLRAEQAFDEFKQKYTDLYEKQDARYYEMQARFDEFKDEKRQKDLLYDETKRVTGLRWERYSVIKEDAQILTKELLDAFDDSDPRWGTLEAIKSEMEDIRNANTEDWALYKKVSDDFDNKYFDEKGKLKLVTESKELNKQLRDTRADIKLQKKVEKGQLKESIKEARDRLKSDKAADRKKLNKERDKARAGELHPGWGRKTTQRQIKKSIRDVLSNGAFSPTECKEIITHMDDVSKQASRLLGDGKDAEASKLIYDAVEDTLKDMKYIDDEAYKASRDLRDLLRTSPISSDLIKGDITDFHDFRKKHFGSYKIRKQGGSLDSLLENIHIVAPDVYNDYINTTGGRVSASNFFEFFDDYLNNNRVKKVVYSDDEKQYFIDKLTNDLFDTLKDRPGYSISDVDDNFTEVYNRYVHELQRPTTYEGVKELSQMEYAIAQGEFIDLAIRQQQGLRDNLENFDFVLTESEDTLDLLQGAHEAEIFNWAARSDYEKRALTYKNGVMKSGLDKATKYIEVGSQIKSNIRQLQHIDDYYSSAGFLRKQDRLAASMHVKAKQLFDILENTRFLKRESFQDFIRRASEVNRVHLQEYRLRALRNADGAFDEDKLLSELVYNGFNMNVFNAHNYEPKDMDDLRAFVKELQKKHDFLSYYEDNTTGNIFIYLNGNCVVSEADGFRYINQDLRFERPIHDAVPYAEFDDLAQMMDIPDIEDFRGVYAHLRSCWEDTRMLSLGQINGTTGRVVSRQQAEEFIQTLPSSMSDWLTSEGLLRDEIARGVIYDPGFVINNESDMLMDFLGTLNRQAEVAKDDAIIINEVFHNTGNIQFEELSRHFSDDELIEYFGNNPEYVVCTIIEGDNTATGFAIKQLNLSTKAGVQMAKSAPNTTILPYDAYYEIANYMNRSVTDTSTAKRLLGRYMLVYKAFALAKPGTWMRNFIDATSKAAFDNNGGVTDVVDMLQYEAKATQWLGSYSKICKTDPSLLTPANWDIIQKTYKTDMTFEDYELLRGIIDAYRYKSADMYYLNKTTDVRGGFNIISGENIGLRNLEQDDISKAFDKYLSNEFNLPLSKKEFLDAYMSKAADIKLDPELDEQFEEMFRLLSNNLRNGSASTMFDKTIDNIFKPFGTVEQVVRYAQALKLRDSGFSSNQITRHIHNTQFYNAPIWGTWHKLETIMPFITFKMNNMMYWVRMMDENPRLFRYFADTYRSVYDTTIESALEEGVELDYANDYGLQSGGLPFGNGHKYLNIGNSFLSAMNDFYGLPFDIDSLNPLLKTTLKGSAYTMGLGSGRFMDETEAQYQDFKQTLQTLIPGYVLAKKGVKTFKDIANVSSTSGGPSMDALLSTLGFLGIVGTRYQYDLNKSGKFSFDEWQDELAAQGKWYDANLGKIVDISLKNEFGANDPANSFRDVQTYMMVHFGKIWDANQHKFVKMEDYQEGGLNLGFGSWEELKDYMASRGKKWDANQRKFVYSKDYISGGLNAEGLEWETVVALMEEKFPNLKWDANQQAFVEKQFYIAGGLNDVQNFREVMGLRAALYGETYNRDTHKFEVTQEPRVVMLNKGYGKRYEDYYTLLAIPHLKDKYDKIHATSDGLLMTDDGKYVLTGNLEHDQKVFDKFRYTYSGRRYSGYKRYSYNKTRRPKKVYSGRIVSPHIYQTGYGWNAEYGYYREAFEYSYQYHSPQPGSKLNRLISPPIMYPYGGGYNKFSFHNRY